MTYKHFTNNLDFYKNTKKNTNIFCLQIKSAAKDFCPYGKIMIFNCFFCLKAQRKKKISAFLTAVPSSAVIRWSQLH